VSEYRMAGPDRSWLQPALNVMMGERGTCDLRFSLQGTYASGDLAMDLGALGVANTVVTAHGSALKAGKNVTESEFVKVSDDEIAVIRESFENYLDGRSLPHRPTDLIILDMEPAECSPRHIGSFETDSQRQADLIRGYRRRIGAARAVLLDKDMPDIKLGMYQVIVPDGQGRLTDGFRERMRGYCQAGHTGMYDELDYLCPVLYQRFGPDDGTEEEVHGWIDAATHQGIDSSLKLTRSDGGVIPLCPLLTFWVANSSEASQNASDAVSPESILRQLRILRRYRAREVEIIVLWAGSGDIEDANKPREPVDFRDFLQRVGELPPPGCAHLASTS
jgi:hypothetical protein